MKHTSDRTDKLNQEMMVLCLKKCLSDDTSGIR